MAYILRRLFKDEIDLFINFRHSSTGLDNYLKNIYVNGPIDFSFYNNRIQVSIEDTKHYILIGAFDKEEIVGLAYMNYWNDDNTNLSLRFVFTADASPITNMDIIGNIIHLFPQVNTFWTISEDNMFLDKNIENAKKLDLNISFITKVLANEMPLHFQSYDKTSYVNDIISQITYNKYPLNRYIFKLERI